MEPRKIANGMEFIHDEEVVGKWEYFATIRSREEFDPEQPGTADDEDFREIYFLPQGEKYWIFEGWTKGFLLVHYGGDEPLLCCPYSIEKRGTERYLFVEMSGGPRICVMKKTSDRQYRLSEIGRRENIEMPFVGDDRVLGRWRSVGFVEAAEEFNPRNVPEKLWLKGVSFEADGTAFRQYDNIVWQDRWTKGFLLDYKKSTASAYFFKVIDGREYLFLQWKMGNYVYGGMEPDYYVFTRE